MPSLRWPDARPRLACTAVVAALFAAAPHAVAENGFDRQTVSLEGRILAAALEDLDGDGVLDPIVAWARPATQGTAGESGDARPAARVLHFYARDRAGAYTLRKELEAPDDAVAFGIGDVLAGGRRELVYFTGQSVFALDLETDEVVRVVADHRSFFAMSSPGALPYWDVVIDVNRDGRDDLVLADPTGYVIYRQGKDRAFAAVGRIEVGSDFANEPLTLRRRRAQGNGPLVNRRAIRRIGDADVDGDTRVDLIAMKGPNVLAYAQRADGSFATEPSVEHRLVAPGTTLFAEFRDAVPPPRIQYGDIDGDGRVDFVVPEIDLRDLVTRLRVFMNGKNGLPEKPTQIIKLSSLGELPQIVDLNGDGRLDLGCTTFRSDRLLSLAAGGGLKTLDFSFFGFLYDAEAGRFRTRPDLRLDASWEIPQGDEPADENPDTQDNVEGFIRASGDFNGDGVRDIAQFSGEGELQVFPVTVSGADRMSVSVVSTPIVRASVEPTSQIEIVDVDADRKSDFVLIHEKSVEILRSR